MYTLIGIIIILLICFFFIVKQLLELKKEQKLTIEELWKIKKEQYENEIVELNIKKEEALEYYNTTISQIEKEIQEKMEFNQSLLFIREEELNRLIEEKRKEKEKTLTAWLALEQQQRIQTLNAEFSQYSSEQNAEKNKIKKEIENIQKELEDFRLQREAINQAVLREKEIREKEYFYKIDISQDDREDILALREIAPRVKNKEAINKLVYEVFIRRPLNELIKRVTGGRGISGIYKITYTKTGEAYIGKTTDIQTRWTNHIKTCCGLEGAARTTFHNRLEKDGLWNYTFEILEEVPKDKLSEREKFYIELYGTNTQLNMKRG
jgi:DNA polymerase III alpha subunit (gram-positive type)